MRLLLSIAAAGLVALGCKSTPEDETRRWQAKLDAASKWSGKYTNFEPAITQRLSEARTMFESAARVEDKAEKLEGMKRANAHLGALVDPFSTYDRVVRELRRLTRDRDVMSLPKREVTPTVRRADRAMSETRQMLRQASPSDPEHAIRIVGNAVTRVEASAKNLRRLRSRARRDKNKAKKQAKGG